MNGSCLCGRVRYRTGNDAYDAVACHCERCRKAAGAVYVAWVSFPVSQFDYDGEAPAEYESSPGVYRSFCNQCGTSITNKSNDRPNEIIVNVCTLDNPSVIVPAKHIWVSKRLPWVEIGNEVVCCEESD